MSEKPKTDEVVTKARSAWKRTKLAVLAVIAVLALIVLFQNYRSQTSVQVLFWELAVKLYLPLLVALIVGIVFGLFLCHLFHKKER